MEDKTENLDEERWARSGIKPLELMASAEEYRSRAYAPYSNFFVGAAILTEDGLVVGGCNVENASYGMSICAERVAMSKAVSEGGGVPIAIAVAGPRGVFCPPCGACRQFLMEFNPGMYVVTQRDGHIESTRLDLLLPSGFKLKECPDAGR
ncbi:MAG: cytidine deaminase [Synergistaceae bacterium]|nr:cytidine deaminase [Synergistaceae bacterium]